MSDPVEVSDIRNLPDGARVWLVGVYEPTAVSKRPEPPPEAGPCCVQIQTDQGANVMLGVYYRESGTRSAEEVARFAGKHDS